mmetsp:Transcript_14833/g.21816  ORF Transcript_14833/g.21816 Transcript_14833/m.21816 type:complete len:479 (+) Transcript_14833:690-2126(+)
MACFVRQSPFPSHAHSAVGKGSSAVPLGNVRTTHVSPYIPVADGKLKESLCRGRGCRLSRCGEVLGALHVLLALAFLFNYLVSSIVRSFRRLRFGHWLVLVDFNNIIVVLLTIVVFFTLPFHWRFFSWWFISIVFNLFVHFLIHWLKVFCVIRHIIFDGTLQVCQPGAILFIVVFIFFFFDSIPKVLSIIFSFFVVVFLEVFRFARWDTEVIFVLVPKIVSSNVIRFLNFDRQLFISIFVIVFEIFSLDHPLTSTRVKSLLVNNLIVIIFIIISIQIVRLLSFKLFLIFPVVIFDLYFCLSVVGWSPLILLYLVLFAVVIFVIFVSFIHFSNLLLNIPLHVIVVFIVVYFFLVIHLLIELLIAAFSVIVTFVCVFSISDSTIRLVQHPFVELFALILIFILILFLIVSVFVNPVEYVEGFDQFEKSLSIVWNSGHRVLYEIQVAQLLQNGEWLEGFDSCDLVPSELENFNVWYSLQRI